MNKIQIVNNWFKISYINIVHSRAPVFNEDEKRNRQMLEMILRLFYEIYEVDYTQQFSSSKI